MQDVSAYTIVPAGKVRKFNKILCVVSPQINKHFYVEIMDYDEE